jgi:energy-coupling factor transport system ATP-binding protein
MQASDRGGCGVKLRVKQISLSYGDTAIFQNLSLSLCEGEILGIKGDNGSGKSSLCLCLSGLIGEEDGVRLCGEILYDGKPLQKMSIAERCTAVGIVFQNPDSQLFSPTVTEELAFGPENLCIPRQEIAARIEEALRLCGIEHLKNAKTHLLSGGEKQLVAIASVLTMHPKILIADEITARVDIEKKERIRNILKSFASNGGAVVLVSHNSRDLAVATKTLELERGKDYADRT